MRSSVIAAGVLLVAACDLQPLSTEVGKHVSYHWDPTEHEVCGGTVRYADQLVEVMGSSYGLGPVDRPAIDYFWDFEKLDVTGCSTVAIACTWQGTNSAATVLSPYPLDAHELNHALFDGWLGGGAPSFIAEGRAGRWESALVIGTSPLSPPFTIDEAELRSLLRKDDLPQSEWGQALAWWSALEATFGPGDMGRLMETLARSSSPNAVDDALRETLGISLGESVELAASVGPLGFDDAACSFSDLPRLVWNGEPMTIAAEDSTCAGAGVVNLYDRVAWPFQIEFPDTFVLVDIHTTSADETTLFRLRSCVGAPHTSPLPDEFISPNLEPRTRYLGGLYVGYLRGATLESGTIIWPEITIEASS